MKIMLILTENVYSSLKYKVKQKNFKRGQHPKLVVTHYISRWTPRFPCTMLAQRRCLEAGTHRDTLIRCRRAFHQVCLVEKEHTSPRTNRSLSLNPTATYWPWAYNTAWSVGTTATPGSVQLMMTGLRWHKPLQSRTSIKCHENSSVFLVESVFTKNTRWRAKSKEFEVFKNVLDFPQYQKERKIT